MINIIQWGTGGGGSPRKTRSELYWIPLFGLGSPWDPKRIPRGSPPESTLNPSILMPHIQIFFASTYTRTHVTKSSPSRAYKGHPQRHVSRAFKILVAAKDERPRSVSRSLAVMSFRSRPSIAPGEHLTTSQTTQCGMESLCLFHSKHGYLVACMQILQIFVARECLP